MKYNPEIHHRRSIRLQGYDYSQAGAYFVTICVQNRACVLGDVMDDKVVLSPSGSLVLDVWRELPCRYTHIELDAFCMMPNDVHGIVVIAADHASPHGLPEIVRVFKSLSARRINIARHTPGLSFWQRNYYEHIIRNQGEWAKIREYILTNPDHWQEDQLHPAAR